MRKFLLSVMSLLCATATYAIDFTVGGVTYSTNGDNTVSITAVDSKLTSVPLTSEVTNEGVTYTVTEIGEEAFRWSTATSLVIPNTVTKLGNSAFTGMRSLSSVTLSENITAIPDYAFYSNTSLASITIPSKVKSLGRSAFAVCSAMQNFTFNEGLETIGNGCFYKAGFSTVTLPSSCKEVGNTAFLMCPNLSTVNLNEGLVKMGDGAFNDCPKLTAITLPSTLQSVGSEAFLNTPITTVTLPKSLTSIGTGAFAKTAITEFKIAAGNPAFVLDGGAVYDTSKRVLYAFPCKGATKANVAAGCVGINGGAFWGSEVQEVTLPSSMLAFDDYAFCQSTLAKINFPKSLVYMGEQALAATNLTEVVLPENMPTVQLGLLAGCKSLTTVTVPSGVNYIDLRAFYGCTGLATIHCLGSVPSEFNEWYEEDEHPFAYVTNRENGVVLSVPVGYKQTYKNSQWGQIFSNIQEGEVAPFVYDSISPADGSKVSKLDGIVVNFSEDATVAVSSPEVVVRKGNDLTGSVVARDAWYVNTSNKKAPRIWPSDYDGYTDPIVLEDGVDYFVTIPAGTFKNAAGALNEKITFMITGFVPSFDPVTFTPANDEALTDFTSVDIQFSEAVKTINSSANVTLKKGTETVSVDAWMMVNNSSDKKTVTVFAADYDGYTAPVKLEKDADYYLTIPAGAFKNAAGEANKEIVLHYVGKDPSFKHTVVSPTNGAKLKSLDAIDITYAEAATVVRVNPLVTVHKGSATGEAIEKDLWVVTLSSDKKSIRVWPSDYDGFTDPIALEPNVDYYVTIPAKTVKNAAGAFNEEIVLHYVGVQPVFKAVSFSPAEGTEMKTFEGVDVTFAEAVTSLNSSAAIKLHKGSATGAVVDVDAWYVVNNSADKKSPRIFPADYDGFTAPVTFEDGVDYYLEVPAGTFKNAEGTGNTAFTLHYMGEAVKFAPVSFSPADGSEMEVFDGVDITFAEAVASVNSSAAVKLHKGSATGAEVDVDAWYVVNFSNDKKSPRIFPADYDGFTAPVTFEAGVDYYLEVPARTFKSAAGAWNEAFTIHYVGQNASGLNSLYADGVVVTAGVATIDVKAPADAEVVLYSLSGKTVAQAKGACQFSGLQKGVWVVKVGTKAVKVMVR